MVSELRIGWLLLLTGTPVQNNMRELWGIMSLLDRRRFGSEAAFLEAYGGASGVDPTIDQILTLQVLITPRFVLDGCFRMPPYRLYL